jgi:hypothetical protein
LEMIHSGLTYIYSDLDLKFDIKYKDVRWNMMIHMDVGKSRNFNKNFMFEFMYYGDEYTMDKEALMEIEVDEDTTFRDLYSESVSIYGLDAIFLERGWLKNKFLKEDKEFNTKEEMNNLMEYNKSFGSSSLISSIRLLGPMTSDSTMISSMERTEEEDKMTEIVGEEVMDSAKRMSEYLRDAMNKDYEEEVDVDKTERMKVITMMDQLITSAFKEDVMLDTHKFKQLYKNFKVERRLPEMHSFIIKQISEFYENRISDGMLMVLYNIVVKSMSHLVPMTTSNNIRKSKYKTIPNNMKFIQSVAENEEMREFIRNL